MKIKNIVLLGILFLLSLTEAQAKKTTFSGYIPDLRDTVMNVKLILRSISSAPVLLNLESEYQQKATNGKFSFTFDIDDISNIYISVNQISIPLNPDRGMFIEPGDSIYVNIPVFKNGDLNFALLKMDFTGYGSQKFVLFKKIYTETTAAAFAALAKKDWIDLNMQERFDFSHRMGPITDSVIRNNNSLVSTEIAEIIKTRVLDASNRELMHFLMDQKPTTESWLLFKKYYLDNDFFKNFVKPGLVYHMQYTHNLLVQIPLLEYGLKTQTFIKGMPYSGKPLLFYKLVSDFYKDYPELKNYILAETIVIYLKSMEFTAESESLAMLFLKDVPSGKLHDFVSDTLASIKKSSQKGSPFINFALENSTGNTVRLSDLKGKVVVLDFWFTGCSACKLLLPDLIKIEEQFKNEAVEFVSISIDQNKEAWKKNLNTYASPNAIKLYTNGEGKKHELIKFSGVSSYPTIIVLDKEGKVIASKISPKKENIIKNIKMALSTL